ncbi:hypothetical protein [uncultured Aureimonas sp.]|uniref:GAP1-N1 domain-containing protein n=1 Tax=uncultured Aureimonas sp. TaxID=1604662 RepID=UPI0025E14622|nr:hypothetical protein [uncultured Aureimonas sp.]
MADRVTGGLVSVEQTLHGYSGGHRLLTGSVQLPDAAARAMLLLSDASGGRSPDPRHGYLTGYPLPRTSTYVLARTWAAPEMSRPGCVWTHSLLIGFADLATLSGAGRLLELFRRPGASFSGYDRRLPLGLTVAETPASTGREDAGALLNALYLQPTCRVEMRSEDPASDEELLLAVWLQQWPRLRRSFRFCTSTGADRSSEGAPFDVQIAPGDAGQERGSLIGAASIRREPVDPVLADALLDLRRPGPLRAFLRRVGGDVPKGRSAMVALCRLHAAVDDTVKMGASFGEALDALDALGPGQAQAARDLLLDRALASVDRLDDRTFAFVREGLSSDRLAIDAATGSRIVRALWLRSPRALIETIGRGDVLSPFASDLVSRLPARELMDAALSDPATIDTLMPLRPDMLAMPELWTARKVMPSGALDVVRAAEAPAVLEAVVAAGRVDLAVEVVRHFGAAETLATVAALSDVSGAALVRWLNAVATDPRSLGGVLSSGLLGRAVLLGLANRLDPDAVPNDYGEDPWLSALRSFRWRDDPEDVDLAAFLMARALGTVSRSSAELLRTSFDRLHRAIAGGDPPSAGAWRSVERRLPWTFPWLEWDRCGRLREAAASTFVERRLDPAVFVRLTDDGPVFKRLAEAAARTRAGRHYLELVAGSADKAPERFMRARAKIARKLV